MTDMKHLTELLTAGGVDAYRISSRATGTYEMFFIGASLETVRRTDTTDTSVTVYVDHDGTTGSSSFSVYATASDSEILASVARAKARALCVFDEAYPLPEGDEAQFTAEGPLLDVEPVALGATLAKTVLDAPAPEGATVNALEVFVTDTEQRIVNSRGIDRTARGRTVAVECIPTYGTGEGAVELYDYYELSGLDLDALCRKVSARMRDVAARHEAKAPVAPIDCPVLLGAGELRTLFRELASDLTYASVYRHASVYELGDAVQKAPVGDRLCIRACAAVEGSARSAHFDADGVLLRDRELIRDGVAVGRYGSHRFAHYLGEEATGQLPCLSVAVGSATEAELRTGAYLECVELSGLQVDLFNDYIGGEVRLAYYADGACRRPVTGISISGKLSEVLNRLTLSATADTVGGYRGPALARLEGMKIF